MRDAAVGFQCPTCVAEGARSTRQGRAPYGGTRSANPALTSLVLVGLNVAVWLAITATGGRASALLDRFGLVVGERCDPVGQAGYYPQVPSEELCTTQVNGSWVTGVADGAWWQLLTSAFTHVEIWHIAVNMLALWFLGPQVERTLGRVRYLGLYLLSALAGSTLVLWFTPSLTQTVGASGAIFGLMGALLVLAHKVGGNVSQIGGWLLINAVITFTFPNISWQGHLGGFLGGALVAALLVYSPRQRRGLWQLIGLGTFTLFLLAALVARVAALS
jgi:membrane associated rhomboid family serine protease